MSTLRLKIHPLAISFGELECCALRSAVNRADHEVYIKTFIRDIEFLHPEFKAALLVDIFEKSNRLEFIPRPLHMSFYSTLAISERKILSLSEIEVLICGHTKKEHIAALEKIFCEVLIAPYGKN